MANSALDSLVVPVLAAPCAWCNSPAGCLLVLKPGEWSVLLGRVVCAACWGMHLRIAAVPKDRRCMLCNFEVQGDGRICNACLHRVEPSPTEVKK